MRLILSTLVLLVSLPALASELSAVPAPESSIAEGTASRLQAAESVETGQEFFLGVRNREARTDDSESFAGDTLVDLDGGGVAASASPLGSLQPNYGIGAWWKNSSKTTRFWSIVGTVVIVGITAAAM
jgi:hypothetical protein